MSGVGLELLGSIGGPTDSAVSGYLPHQPLYKPQGLRRWFAALGDFLYSQPTVMWAGHSIPRGVGSDGVFGGVGEEKNQAPRGEVERLRKLFMEYTGIDTGPGMLLLPDYRVTFSGGTLYNDTAPMTAARAILSTQNVSVTAQSARYWDILSYWNAADENATQYLYYPNSEGAGVEVDHTAEINKFKIDTYDAGAIGEKTFQVKGKFSGKRARIGAVSLRKTTNGVLVHRVARAGYSSADVLGAEATNPAAPWSAETLARYLASFTVWKPNVLIWQCDTNDMAKQSTVGELTTPAVFKANVQKVITAQIAAGGCVLLLKDPPSTSDGSPHTEAEYATVLKELADENDHVAFIDLRTAYGSRANSEALGLQTIEVHPTSAGHGVASQVVFAALTRQMVAT